MRVNWDVSVNHGSNKFSLDIDDTANLGLGTASPTSFHVGALENSQTLLNVDAVHDIEVGLATPLTLALGAEAREERYEVRAGDADSYSGSGAQGFSGFRATDAGRSRRHSEAAYVDLEAGFTRSLSGSLALRTEHYTITTTTTNFIVVNGVNTPLETGTFAVDSAAARALGAQPLRAEKSRKFSVGALFTPAKNWRTTVDVYQIDIAHRVGRQPQHERHLPLQQLLAVRLRWSRGVREGGLRLVRFCRAAQGFCRWRNLRGSSALEQHP